MNKLTRKCVAAIASLAMAGTLCVAGAVTMASVAWGAGPHISQPTVSKEPWGSHVPKGPYSITIVNCDAKVVDGSQGSSQCDAGHKPLDGAVFKLTPIKKIGDTEFKSADDFKKAETWSKIATTIDALNRGKEDEAKIELDKDSNNIKTKDVSNGVAKFDNVALGFYKVEETKMPTGNYGANDTTVFYMTLPQIERKQKDNDNTKFVTNYNYNPIVKIKNKDLSSAITKVFSTEKGSNAVSVKDAFDYVISAEVNHPAGTLDADSIKDYAVFDDAPGDAFDFTDTSNIVKSVKMDGVNDALTKGTDYTVEIKQNSTTQAITDNDDSKNLAAQHTRILVKFTPTGLGKIADALNKAQAGTEPKVHVTVSFKLKDAYKNGNVPKAGETDTTGKNEIKNKSGFFKSHPHNATKDPNPIIPDGGVKDVKLGYLQVNKHDAKTTTETLSGAEFKIFNSIDKAEACKAALLKLPADSAEVPDVCNTGASANSGGTTVDGGGFSAAQKVVAGTPLYLIEVKAPTGYARPNSITNISVAEKELTTVDVPNTKISDLNIETWFNLPATGAAGVILFALAGMGLIAASVFLYMRNRKEEEQAKA